MSAPNHVLPMGATPVEPVTFPRAAADNSIGYTSGYRVDHKHTMRRWVDRTLVGLPSDKHELAQGIAYQAAKAEVGRPLRSSEIKLLSEATRDWLDARATLEARR